MKEINEEEPVEEEGNSSQWEGGHSLGREL